jgi:hypothetical protein
LPTLKAEARPSKHAIVDASIAYHHTQQTRCLRVNQALQSMMTERDDLLREVNGLRALCQPGTCVPRQARPVDPTVLGMLAESKVSAADLTGEHESIDELPVISPHMAGQSMSGSQPGTTLSAVPQASPIDSSNALQQPDFSHVPDVHSLAILDTGISLVDPSEWDWEEPSKLSRQMGFHPTIMDEAAWNQSADILVATPPRDAANQYAANSFYLVDDAARFWAQHPGLMNATPPSGRAAFDSPTISSSWRPHPLTLNVLPQEASQVAIHQMHTLANSFSSDPESLSIPMGDMVETDTANPSATLCSATN